MPRKNLRPLPDQLLTIRKVAEWLRVHPNTLRNWTNSGMLRTYRIGMKGERRFSAADVEAHLTGHRPKKVRDIERDRLLSVQEASRWLGVHPNTLRNWDRQGKLTAVRIGSLGERRFSERKIVEYLRACGTGPRSELQTLKKASEQSL